MPCCSGLLSSAGYYVPDYPQTRNLIESKDLNDSRLSASKGLVEGELLYNADLELRGDPSRRDSGSFAYLKSLRGTSSLYLRRKGGLGILFELLKEPDGGNLLELEARAAKGLRNPVDNLSSVTGVKPSIVEGDGSRSPLYRITSSVEIAKTLTGSDTEVTLVYGKIEVSKKTGLIYYIAPAASSPPSFSLLLESPLPRSEDEDEDEDIIKITVLVPIILYTYLKYPLSTPYNLNHVNTPFIGYDLYIPSEFRGRYSLGNAIGYDLFGIDIAVAGLEVNGVVNGYIEEEGVLELGTAVETYEYLYETGKAEDGDERKYKEGYIVASLGDPYKGTVGLVEG
ncbi:hypothetical protein QBC39DRAFT_327851 [Podospora conica]|nr:hypothetical protein QBC39DRAFT_327851 [Schizothecium conicum]